MPERLESHLALNQIAFSLISHRPTPTAQLTASSMHLSGKMVAKSVALCAGEKSPGDPTASYRINFEKLSAIVGERVQLLEQEKCNEEFPDCETGATIPPFGELYGAPVILDAALAEDPEIVFSAGTCARAYGWAMPISYVW